jgi:hypothetical protein
VNLLCPLLSEPCPIADWGVNETLALLSFVVTSLALFATAWFARDAARQTEKLVRSELTAVLDMPTRPFGPEDEPYGEGLSIHLGRHAHGCHVSFSGGLRNIGRYPASDVGLVPEIEGAETELVIMAGPQATLFPHKPHNQISFMWPMDGTVDGAETAARDGMPNATRCTAGNRSKRTRMRSGHAFSEATSRTFANLTLATHTGPEISESDACPGGAGGGE